MSSLFEHIQLFWLSVLALLLGSLGCCSPWGHKESDTTEQLNWVWMGSVSCLYTQDEQPTSPVPPKFFFLIYLNLFFYVIFCFFLNLFTFNWRLIALQYCTGFCCTLTWIRHRYTYVPSLLNLPPTSHSILPLWVVIEHQCEFPKPYSKFPVDIYFTYGSIYVSMLLFIHPTLFFPLVCTSLFSMSTSPLLPLNRFISTIFLDSIYIYIYMC